MQVTQIRQENTRNTRRRQQEPAEVAGEKVEEAAQDTEAEIATAQQI